jgi:hypothetical protein
MSNMDEYAVDTARRMTARAELIREQGCDHWPTVYKNLLPATDSRAAFLEAKAQIERMMADDFEAYRREQSSPWEHVGPPAKLVRKDDDLQGRELFAAGLKLQRMLGFPAPVKNGKHPLLGIPYREHQEVIEAQKNAHRTAEWVAEVTAERLMRRWQAASSAYVKAANGGDSKAAKKCKSQEEAAQKAYEEARQISNELRADPKAGLKIVREPQSEEQLRRERQE